MGSVLEQQEPAAVRAFGLSEAPQYVWVHAQLVPRVLEPRFNLLPIVDHICARGLSDGKSSVIFVLVF